MAGPEDGVEESAAKMWRDERWLQSNELNENSVLDYFALSDWYTDAISLPPFPCSPPLPLTSWLRAGHLQKFIVFGCCKCIRDPSFSTLFKACECSSSTGSHLSHGLFSSHLPATTLGKTLPSPSSLTD
jgi:hypothetical protein